MWGGDTMFNLADGTWMPPNTAYQTRQLWYTREVDFYECCWMKTYVYVVSNPVLMLSNAAHFLMHFLITVHSRPCGLSEWNASEPTSTYASSAV